MARHKKQTSKQATIAAVVGLFVFLGMFVILSFVHEDEHQEVCRYFGGNPSEIELINGKLMVHCYNVSATRTDAHYLAQSNIESNELSILPFSFICMLLAMIAFLLKK